MIKTQETQEVLKNLKTHPLEVVQEAYAHLLDSEMNYLSVDTFPDPGEECKAGTINVKKYNELNYNERLVEEPNFLEAHFLEEGALVQRAVGRIVKTNGNAWGTGFLVGNSIMMTNNHVIRTKDEAANMKLQMNYQNDHEGNPLEVDTYYFNPDELFYTNEELDFTIVRVKSKRRVLFANPNMISDFHFTRDFNLNAHDDTGLHNPAVSRDFNWMMINAGDRWGNIQLPNPTEVTFIEPVLSDPVTWQHVNIIQHPRGRKKEIAIQRNIISHIYQQRIRYTTDTEPGSSGSPVFNNNWDLLALHHAAGELTHGQWRNNEGMRMDRIVQNLITYFNNTPGGTDILTELNL